jgi:hypothetical protein
MASDRTLTMARGHGKAACCPPLLLAAFIRIVARSGRFSDTCFDEMSVSVRAWIIRWASSLDRIAFKEEVMGSNPIRATR